MFFDLIGGAAIAALSSITACRLLMRFGPIDTPHAERHAHDTPTPTSGGLGIAVGFSIGLIVLALFSESLRVEVSAQGALLLSLSAIFAYGLLILGFWDDAHELSAKLKFAIFAALSLCAVFALGPVREFPIGNAVWTAPLWFALLGSALWVFTVVNSVNFMDGANGLAMGSVAIGMVVLGILALTHNDGSGAGAAEAFCLAGALGGFLIWNFPHGRLFAGDSGALFAGGIVAFGSILVIHRTGLSPVVPAIIFFPLLADALVTLAWRAYRRRSLLDGHSEHVYQILIHGGLSHAEVSLIYWAAMAVCGGIALLVAPDPGVSPWVALAIMAFVALVLSAIVRRFAERRGVSGV